MDEHSYERIAGILLKTRPEYARNFLEQWRSTGKSQVFCIYDRRPYLHENDHVFCYAVEQNRLVFVAKFVRSEWIRAFKHVEKREQCLKERIWSLYGNGQLHTTHKEEFDGFWERWDGVRSMVVLKELRETTKPVTWSDIRKVLYTNFPRGVGYYYLSQSEVKVLLELASII